MTGSGAARHFAPKNRPHFSPSNRKDECLLLLREIRRVIHNHPSGDPTPSRADIDMTQLIISTAKPLGITVHDHIIIGKNGNVSMKGLRLI